MAVTLAPVAFQYLPNNNNTGSPAAGFKLFTYVAGTSTKQATWTDSTGSVQNSNPLPLDANGFIAASSGSSIWVDPTLSYKFVWALPTDTDPPASPLRTQDNIQGPISITVLGQTLYPRTTAEIAAGVTPTNFLYVSDRSGPYDIRREGALVNNSADDTAALNNAISVAAQPVNGSQGGAVTIQTGVSLLSSQVTLPDRVRILGVNKRGSYFQAKANWSVGSAWNSGTNYVVGNYVTIGGSLYYAKAASLNQTPPNTTFWRLVSDAVFYANNGTLAGGDLSMFDSTIENLSVDAQNIPGLGCVLSSAWQEDCGSRGCLLINFATYGVKLQDGFGGASLSKIVDAEIFGGTYGGPSISAISQAAQAVVTSSVSTGLYASINPFQVNDYIWFSGISGMTQINGLVGRVLSTGGSAGSWTANVNINSSAFTAYTSGGVANNTRGIDLATPLGSVAAFMLDVSNTSIVGGAATLGTGIVSNGNSFLCRQVHFETANTGVLVDGLGHVLLQDLTGNPTCTTLVTIGSNFVGTLQMQNCRRNGSTNLIVDLRIAQIATFGAITAGSGYVNNTYNNVPLTGGTGTGAQAQIIVSGNAVTSVAIQVPGTGYAVSDTLSASNTNLGGSGSGFSIPVATIFTGLGTLAADYPNVIVNPGDSGNTILISGSPQNSLATPPVKIIGAIGGNHFQCAAANANPLFGIQTDTVASYIGNVSNHNLNLMTNNVTRATISLTTGNAVFNSGLGMAGNTTTQVTGFGTPTGTGVIANFPGATATLAQTSQAVAEIIKDLKAFGLYGA